MKLKTVYDLYIKSTTHYFWKEPVLDYIWATKGKIIFLFSMVFQLGRRDALWMKEDMITIKAVCKKKQICDAQNKH